MFRCLPLNGSINVARKHSKRGRTCDSPSHRPRIFCGKCAQTTTEGRAVRGIRLQCGTKKAASLDARQIAWRRGKISQLGSSEYFSQEYPLTASEAFISSTFDSFIPAELVIKARQEKIEPYGPLIIGVDPAGAGADRTSIAWRQGRCITKIESRRGIDTMETVGWIKKIIREDKPAKVNVDVG